MSSDSGPLKRAFWYVLDLLVTFILQVLGGAGAIWGCSEWLDVRAGPNNNAWRVISDIVGVACLARWCLIKVAADHRLEGVLSTFLLQVWGAAGAIWGVAEICGLRTQYPENCHLPQNDGEFTGPGRSWSPGYESCQNTYTLWRVICTPVFLLFFCRWNNLAPKGCLGRALDHVATFVLEVFGGAGAVWGSAEIVFLRTGWGDPYFGQPSFDFWRWVCVPTFLVCLFAWAADWRSREACAIQQGEEKEEKEQALCQETPADGEGPENAVTNFSVSFEP